MPAPMPPSGAGPDGSPDAGPDGGPDGHGVPDAFETSAPARRENQERAAEALRAAFTRLAPQGSDAWNFLGAFTHLGDRYGPYHPGASELSDALEAEARGAKEAPRHGRRLRSVMPRGRAHGAAEVEKTELEEAMGHVVEAFRFLSARVATLEARLAAEDRPVEGAAWLTPARALGAWAGPVAAHVLATTPGGDIVHADCGDGALLAEMAGRGAVAHGVEPRGAVALRALEDGWTVTIGEVAEHLATRRAASLGGVVLSGVVDRLPLHGLLPLLAQCRRTLRRGAPLVVLAEPVSAAEEWEAPARDLLGARPLHEATWEMLLDRSGFLQGAPLAPPAVGDGRIAVTAAAPT